ncbi:hypothetical protein [Paenibacillus popilliae]|uniref:PPM-type phosphatase domain-containing protein n=1 Tax=Paenibacillus popilliae TaxID=78057 RepID=A0ABY3AW70_PAEPP|nr:hypothetical protein [Paenibacillus sp. SDF0028]TQR47057.1 hypothetical protein C7Y44_05335 [Paenibacillus sp. SDF0028]
MSLTSFHYRCSQQVDQPLMTIEQSSFRCRFAYARAGETAQYKDNNQDYLAFRIDGGSLSFVLCDGVSLSYQGDFAARFLGAHLLDWIAVQSELNTESLHAYLDSLRDAAAEQMSGLAIPSGLPPLVKEVLEDKKRIGSEAMFTCGRIDGTDGTDEAKPYSRIWLAWHGDGRRRLWQHGQESCNLFETSSSNGERWSVYRGLIGGRAHTLHHHIEGNAPFRLMVYTDGLSELDSLPYPPADELLRHKLEHRNGEMLEDDVSLLDISWSSRGK